ERGGDDDGQPEHRLCARRFVYANTYTHIDSDVNTNADEHADCNADEYADCNADEYADCNADEHADEHAGAYEYANPDAAPSQYA
ncbi:MAG TPA: hypothetical protein PLJ62_08470, partial [Thermoflexales bacterium]|nr:hypothetical protein [Thermoflexales bacterium]